MFNFGLLSCGLPYIIIGTAYFVYLMTFAVGKYFPNAEKNQSKENEKTVFASYVSGVDLSDEDYIVTADDFVPKSVTEHPPQLNNSAETYNYRHYPWKIPFHCKYPSLFPNPPPVLS